MDVDRTGADAQKRAQVALTFVSIVAKMYTDCYVVDRNYSLQESRDDLLDMFTKIVEDAREIVSGTIIGNVWGATLADMLETDDN